MTSNSMPQQRRAMQQLSALLETLQRLQSDNERLRYRLSYVEAGIDLADKEQANQLKRKLGKLSSKANMRLGKAPPLFPSDRQLAGSATAVSVWALPQPGAWSSAFDEHVQDMSVFDMVVLHRQYLQETAMLLPKAELGGPGSPPYLRLLSLMDRYAAFNQQAITLAPQAWAQRSYYNMETLEPVQMESKGFFEQVNRKSRARIAHHFQELAQVSHGLQQTYQELSNRHQELLKQKQGGGSSDSGASEECVQWHSRGAGQDGQCGEARQDCGAAGLAVHGGQSSGYGAWDEGERHRYCSSGSTGTASSGGSGSRHSDEEWLAQASSVALQEVVEQMAKNLIQQKLAVKHCFHALWMGLRETDCVDVGKAWLTMYPLPFDIVDFLDALMGTAVRRRPAGGQGGHCSVTQLP